MSSPGDPTAAPVAGAGTAGSSDIGSIKDWLSAVKADEKDKPTMAEETKCSLREAGPRYTPFVDGLEEGHRRA